MSAIGLLILQMMMMMMMMMVGWSSGQFSRGSAGGGGPSTFGYDGSSACSKPYSRNGRARFEKLPCDFRRQNWCTVAGSAYPWHAVRRFVQENQGLMRRMYGDERHINILRAELEKNDIELEYDDRYQRYPDESRRFQYEDEYEFANKQQRSNEKIGSSEARSLNVPITDRTTSYTKKSSENSRSETSETTISPNLSSSRSTIVTEIPSSTSPTIVNNPDNILTILSTVSVSSVTTTEPILTIKNITDSIVPIANKIVSTLSSVALSDIARINNSSINEIPGKTEKLEDRMNFDNTDLPIFPETTTITSENTTLEASSSSSSSSSSSTSRIVETTTKSSSSIDRIDGAEIAEESLDDSSSIDRINEADREQSSQQQFRPRPEYRPTIAKPETPNIAGQLFQDVAAKDQQEQPILKLRGVNACPVKEEVVAPFWANNTRGEVLALLNLYPFEQYVHWEKCTHENKQMYCRDGCRCEQQYRLHRLLAYDPNNECRGIFSDWFKFPSCCVCRCYDLPIEFRVTSRSPRIQKQKLRLRPPGHERG